MAVDGCVALLLAASAVAHAQGYPSRPVRLIVPTSPGGGTDISARMIAPKLAEYLGQQIVVDNRPGASTMIGVELVARAAPDGYTLLMGISSLAIAPYIQTKVPYDAVKDFAPVSQVVVLSNLMVSHPSLPARAVKELVAFARTRPGQINFAAGSVGSNPHLAMELFLSMTGLKMVHVPYKGQGPALIDLMAGHVSLSMANMLIALPHVKNGRLRAIGVTGAKRASVAPDIPTIAEAGVPGYEVVQWFGVLAPAHTPRDIIARLHAGIVRAVQDPAIRERFSSDGAETVGSTPEEFAAVIRADLGKWSKVIKDAGIKPE
ncbi:MAG: tripartite tricarboxylate transporter substrate binding protein [Betaproteobacteria bacterium]|nr:tripartite tricarboxylate transporter substrate binding protein [Betaproteobacteria bacterium]MBI3054660.1 tripartite tricarboxylate transporter substrate binding protein [Betaproteobacteria bacterium]